MGESDLQHDTDLAKNKHISEDIRPLILPPDSFLENISTAPLVPDILIIGKDRSTHHGFGPAIKINNRTSKKPGRLVFKTLLLFLTVIAISMLGAKAVTVKNQLSTLSDSAKEHLHQSMNLINEGDLPGSIKEADLASSDISRLKLLAQSWGQDTKLLQVLNPNSKLVANEQLLDATYSIVNTLNSVSDKMATIGGSHNSLNSDGGSDFLFNIQESSAAINSLVNSSSISLAQSKSSLESAKPKLDKITQADLDSAIGAIDKTISSLETIKAFTQSDLPWLSGTDGRDKNILVLFQNNNELRGGSGGSLGSFGVAKFSGGKLKKIDFGKNIYKIDNPFEKSGEMITPPDEIKWLRGNSTWTLKDSGWAVDGPEASQKILWFYQKETGEKLDGTIMIDTTAVISLLKILGSIEMPAYNKTIDANNFRQEIEFEVHKGYFDKAGGKEENEPKKILSDMMPILMERLFKGLGDKDVAFKLLGSFSDSLKQKDITMYFSDYYFQKRIEKLGFAGAVNPAAADYLYVNNSNIAGEKSSLNIEQSINLNVNIKADGSIINHLDISRKHIGTGIWPDGINKNFVRILLPQNSSISKFEPRSGNFQQYYEHGIYPNNQYYYLSQEAGKQTLNFWMSTEPGQTSQASLDYAPNYRPVITENGFDYVLSLQKQPGANSDQVVVSVQYPVGFYPTNVSNVKKDAHELRLNLKLDHDQTIKLSFKKS